MSNLVWLESQNAIMVTADEEAEMMGKFTMRGTERIIILMLDFGTGSSSSFDTHYPLPEINVIIWASVSGIADPLYSQIFYN
ncbi:unnamed protein product [Heterobilharzia americana]|nr:unnamed protein product [Heterobilharzia americana]